MTKMIQVRNVPEEMHRDLKARAALAGKSMSDYILEELERSLQRPTREELLERVSATPRIELTTRPADILRQEREGR